MNYTIFNSNIDFQYKIMLSGIVNLILIYELIAIIRYLSSRFNYYALRLDKSWILKGTILGIIWIIFGFYNFFQINDILPNLYLSIGIAHFILGFIRADRFVIIGENAVIFSLRKSKLLRFNKIKDMRIDKNKLIVTCSDIPVEFDIISFDIKNLELIIKAIKGRVLNN